MGIRRTGLPGGRAAQTRFLTPGSRSDFEQLFQANATAVLGYAIRRSNGPDDAAGRCL